MPRKVLAKVGLISYFFLLSRIILVTSCHPIPENFVLYILFTFTIVYGGKASLVTFILSFFYFFLEMYSGFEITKKYVFIVTIEINTY